MKKISIILLVFFIQSLGVMAGNTISVHSVEPSSWWTDMEYNEVQLIIYGEDLSGTELSIPERGIEVVKIHSTKNSNYLFVDINILPEAKAGKYTLELKKDGAKRKIDYFLKPRKISENKWQGFDASDAIYLLMPDRFANGDSNNDSHDDLSEKANRSNPDGRHGGDIAGIRNNLDYISDMGFTALWINPLLENDRPAYSYHGYAITDFYKVDARYGSNEDYLALADEAHEKGLKLIMDLVFNHCGINHYTIEDPPVPNWVNEWDSFTRSNFRGEVQVDPHVSEYDHELMNQGWFDTPMADLNQSNPYLLKYLTQASIWWIEYLGLDGIRMDTYPYPQKDAMAKWAKTIKKLYPEFTILGEVWLQKTAHTAYWQESTKNYDGYNSHVPVVTDFPLNYAVNSAFHEEEGWTEGLRRLYYTLSEDFLYPNPNKLTIFPDNHDVNRYYTSMQEDLAKYKMGLAFYFTTRGIPQIYYGTEILMTGEEHTGHGNIRQDFPGGWENDSIDAFTGKGLTVHQLDAQNFVKKTLNWRKDNKAIHEGALKHFIPNDNVYVYFRYTDAESVMVVINANAETKELKLNRFQEGLEGYSSGINIIDEQEVLLDGALQIAPKTAMILELKK